MALTGNLFREAKRLYKGVNAFIRSTNMFREKEFKIMNIGLGFDFDYSIKLHLFLYRDRERYIKFIQSPEIEVIYKETEDNETKGLYKCKIVFRIKEAKNLDELEDFINKHLKD